MKTSRDIFIRGSLAAAAAAGLLALLLAACGAGSGAAGSASTDRIRIVTTIAQIADPIRVIGGGRVDVESLMGPGVDPHLYKPVQSDITKLERADLVLYSGLHLEANMLKAFAEIGKHKPVLAMGDAVAEERLLKDKNGAVDPHIWFDIDLWKEAIASAVEQLKRYSEEDAAYFEANKVDYFKQLDQLKTEAIARMSQIPEERRVLVTAHDAFGYFGRMLGLKVIGLQGLSTEDEIGISDIEETIALLKQYRVPAVFVESSINPNSINAVIEGAREEGLNVRLGGELFSDAMGAEGTAEGTYLGMYRHNVETIFQALSGTGE
jgi:manganese/zinc/iron transport system substrate-binding protein